tara:strand:- start:810 stop:977 length:168 start_codon:yes stop_codon:yes gene_type:complete
MKMNKYEKELQDCTESQTEISQECRDYFKAKFETTGLTAHQAQEATKFLGKKEIE